MSAGLVAGAGDDAAAAEAADQDRPSAQGGAGQLLDGREERIHVEMQDPAPGGQQRSDPGIGSDHDFRWYWASVICMGMNMCHRLC